jgi:transcriptional regulator with XRE-family HTH domain
VVKTVVGSLDDRQPIPSGPGTQPPALFRDAVGVPAYRMAMGAGPRAGRRGPEAVPNFDPEALLRVRTERGLSQDQLCATVGITRPALIWYEKGRRRPTPKRLVELARGLGVDPLDLTTATVATASIADLRTRAGLTRQDVTGELGVARSEYDRIERGEVALVLVHASALCGLLGVSIEGLLRASERAGRAGLER